MNSFVNQPLTNSHAYQSYQRQRQLTLGDLLLENRVILLQGEIHDYYSHFHVTRDLLELRNLVQVADLIVQSARARHESRGLHFSRDYPEMAASALPTTLVPEGLPEHWQQSVR